MSKGFDGSVAFRNRLCERGFRLAPECFSPARSHLMTRHRPRIPITFEVPNLARIIIRRTGTITLVIRVRKGLRPRHRRVDVCYDLERFSVSMWRPVVQCSPYVAVGKRVTQVNVFREVVLDEVLKMRHRANHEGAGILQDVLFGGAAAKAARIRESQLRILLKGGFEHGRRSKSTLCRNLPGQDGESARFPEWSPQDSTMGC